MSFSDWRMAAAWMEACQAEAQRLAKERKLREEAGLPDRDVLSRQICRMLCWLGTWMITAGQRLEAYGPPKPLQVEGKAGRSG
jgi:hypothetical protein